MLKDKNDSLLIIRLHSVAVAGGTVTGGVESSVDFNKTFNFSAEAGLFTALSVPFAATLSLLFVTFPLKYFLFFFLLNFYICLKNPYPMKNTN